MHTEMFKRIDLSSRRRVLVAGDVHGTFDLLEQKLAQMGFDAALDTLVLLGDLVDRGEFDDQALNWCARPGIERIRGNHEELLNLAVHGEPRHLLNHLQNGGKWFLNITDEAERKHWADTLLDCPVAIEAKTPAGRTVGFVHGDVPAQSWGDMVSLLSDENPRISSEVANDCMWQRERIEALKSHMRKRLPIEDHRCAVPGIDHVFFGHSIVKTPVKHDNCSWIDTGAFATGNLTIIDVDHWLSH